jgi:hypothetical protein
VIDSNGRTIRKTFDLKRVAFAQWSNDTLDNAAKAIRDAFD